jgi:hypothetical protein
MDAYKDLMTEFEAKSKEFRKREAEFLARLAALDASRKSGVHEAKVATLERKGEEALATENLSLIQKFQKDMQALKKETESEGEQVRALDLELKEIQAQIVEAAKETFEEVFLKVVCLEAHEGFSRAVDFNDQALLDAERFAKEIGIPFSWTNCRNALSPFSLSGSKVLQRKLEKWI